MARGRAHLSNTSKVTFLKDIGANKSIGDMPTKSGPDYKSWPYVGRCVLFTNSVLSSTHTPIASVSNSPGDSKQSLDQILSGNNPISESEDEIPF